MEIFERECKISTTYQRRINALATKEDVPGIVVSGCSYFTYLTSSNFISLRRLNSMKNLMAHKRYESSWLVEAELRSSTLRTWRTSVLYAERKTSMQYSRKHKLKRKESENNIRMITVTRVLKQHMDWKGPGLTVWSSEDNYTKRNQNWIQISV